MLFKHLESVFTLLFYYEEINDLNSNKLDKTTVASSSTLWLVKSGTDITVDSSGNVSVNDDSHNHVISNVDGLQNAESEEVVNAVFAICGDKPTIQ